MQGAHEFMKAKYSEWLVSLFGAYFIAFALVAWFQSTFIGFAWIIFVSGLLLALWEMYKTYERNK